MSSKTDPAGQEGAGRPRIGLVLGAGGTVGQAYQAGVLAAIEQDLGWDPRDAEIIVGTSAGSITGALLRLGVPAADLAAWAVEAPLSADGRPLQQLLGGERPEFPPMTLRTFLRPPRLPSPALVKSVLRRPWRFRPSVALMTLLQPGSVDLSRYGTQLDRLCEAGWLDRLYVCAARRDDGRRVVFGRPGAPEAPPSKAVAASCAIPGYFQPVEIDGVEYFDGGVHSATNATVLRREQLDLVIVVSPMSAAPGTRPHLDAPFRRAMSRQLQRELRVLQKAGMRVVAFEPGDHALRVMGVNMMAPDRSERTVQQSFIETGSQPAMAELRAMLPRAGADVEPDPAPAAVSAGRR